MARISINPAAELAIEPDAFEQQLRAAIAKLYKLYKPEDDRAPRIFEAAESPALLMAALIQARAIDRLTDAVERLHGTLARAVE